MTVPARPRVADFSTHLSGPMASRLLSELGADVVKIENPRTGDGNRGLIPRIDGVGAMHLALGAGARSLAVDRRSPHWDAVVEACAKWADVVLVGARPSDARRLGIDFESVHRANPGAVYCLVSGFGEVGPWQDMTAHGQTMDAMAGLVPIEWDGDVPRTPAGWRSSGTTLAGIHAALGISYALYQRASGFDGPLSVHVSVWGSAMFWSWRDATCLANLGEPWSEYRELGTRYAMYGTADQRVLLLAPVERKFWEVFCDAAGLPQLRDRGDWASGPDFGRGPEYREEAEILRRRVSELTLDEWGRILDGTGVPFAPVLTLGEALSSEHASVNSVMAPTTLNGREVQVPAAPVTVSSNARRPPGPPPAIGEHTDSVLEEIGLGRLKGKLGATGVHT
jgi:crotonobetainyl-CoA:carnitine CoA-transferase CaiB-like acyl-CoA transferase